MKWLTNKKQLMKSYSVLSMIANIMMVVSVAALTILGILSESMALPILGTLTTVFSLMGTIGRFIDQGLDQMKEDADVES